jgi:hypothetical protein
MKLSKILGMVLCGLLFIAASGCENETPNGPEKQAIEITSPAAGDTWTVGEPQTITWEYNADVQAVSSFGIKLLTNNGRNDKEISGGSLPLETRSFTYTPLAEEAGAASVKVYDYADESINAVSGSFTIQ